MSSSTIAKKTQACTSNNNSQNVTILQLLCKGDYIVVKETYFSLVPAMISGRRAIVSWERTTAVAQELACNGQLTKTRWDHSPFVPYSTHCRVQGRVVCSIYDRYANAASYETHQRLV